MSQKPATVSSWSCRVGRPREVASASLSVRIGGSPEAVGAAYVASRQGRRTAIAKMANAEQIGDAGK